jgi:hypothetical protein
MNLWRFHRNEGGAIALLALAGILITFLTALILFDAGFAVRHKFKAQISADAAAYSQAAIKARVMNDIAYVNVAKRTMLGLWGMYVGMMYQFYRETRGNVICAMAATENLEFLNFFSGASKGSTSRLFEEDSDVINQECDGAADQYAVFYDENLGDWYHFSGTDARDGYSAFTANYSGHSTKWYRKNIARFEKIQLQLLETTPKWSMVEGMVRARASGADKVDAFMTNLPSRKGVPTQTCLNPDGHVDGSITNGPEVIAEINANRHSHARRSVRESKFSNGYEEANLEAGHQRMGTVGCASLLNNFDLSMAPWIPTRRQAQDFVSTARNTPLEEFRGQHFEWLRRSEDLGHPEVKEYEGVSCGEIVDLAPEFRGFRASWAPRIAPMGKCRGAYAGWWK